MAPVPNAASGTRCPRLRLEVGAALKDVEQPGPAAQGRGYAERRRLERDVHDGAHQRLVAIGTSLRLAQRHFGTNGAEDHRRVLAVLAFLGTVTAA